MPVIIFVLISTDLIVSSIEDRVFSGVEPSADY
jgi:hypothetical protein